MTHEAPVANAPSTLTGADVRTLLACHIGLGVTISPAFIGVYGLLLQPMAEGVGWSRADVAMGMSIVSAIAIVAVAIAGMIVDKFGARPVTLIAALGLPCAILLMALAPPSWAGFVAAAMFMGIWAGAASPAAYLRLLSGWFDRRLGLALAIGVSGMGVGQIVNTFVLSHLIDVFGWRSGWMLFGGFVAIVGLMAHTLVPWAQVRHENPASRKVQGATVAQDSPPLRPCWQEARYWMMTLAFTLVLLVTVAVQVNIASALADRGQAYLASTAIATMGAASLIARFTGGILLDHFPARRIGVGVFVLQCLGCILLATLHTPAGALIGVFVISFAFGVEADILPFVARREYGIVQFGKAYGIMFGAAQMGTVIGPFALALARDRFGSYDPAMFVLASCSALAAILLFLALRPGRQHALARRI